MVIRIYFFQGDEDYSRRDPHGSKTNRAYGASSDADHVSSDSPGYNTVEKKEPEELPKKKVTNGTKKSNSEPDGTPERLKRSMDHLSVDSGFNNNSRRRPSSSAQIPPGDASSHRSRGTDRSEDDNGSRKRGSNKPKEGRRAKHSSQSQEHSGSNEKRERSDST